MVWLGVSMRTGPFPSRAAAIEVDVGRGHLDGDPAGRLDPDAAGQGQILRGLVVMAGEPP